MSEHASEPCLLELEDVHASYGPFRAIFGVSLRIPEGKVVALLGSNGAGKTTVARVASGLVKPTAGTVRLRGRDVTGMRTFKLARLGVAHSPEGRSVFASLTVEENLVLEFRRELSRSAVPAALDRAFSLFPRLAERRRQVAGTLSGGEQRMLALARVLVRPPALLICDELSLGLAPIVVDDVYRVLARVREEGTSLLIVEQHVGHALELSDEVVLLDKGQVAFSGPTAEVRDGLAERLLPSAGGGAGRRR